MLRRSFGSDSQLSVQCRAADSDPRYLPTEPRNCPLPRNTLCVVPRNNDRVGRWHRSPRLMLQMRHVEDQSLEDVGRLLSDEEKAEFKRVSSSPLPQQQQPLPQQQQSPPHTSRAGSSSSSTPPPSTSTPAGSSSSNCRPTQQVAAATLAGVMICDMLCCEPLSCAVLRTTQPCWFRSARTSANCRCAGWQSNG